MSKVQRRFSFRSKRPSEQLLALKNGEESVFDVPLKQLNLQTELVRVAQTVNVKSANASFEGSEEKPIAELVKSFLQFLLKEAQIDSLVVQKVAQQLAQAKDSDIIDKLKDLFEGKVLEENSKASKILKLLSSKAIQSSVKQLRESISEKYPYGGVSGSGRTDITISENGQIFVIHSRKEKSHTQDPEASFFFVWNCTLTYDTFGDYLKTETNVTSFEFDERMRAPIKREIRNLIDPFISEANAYRLLWSRNLLRLPVHKDIARLAGSIEIVELDEVLYKQQEDSNVPPSKCVRDLLWTLASKLNDKPLMESIEKKYYDYVKNEGDLSEQLLNYFHTEAFNEKSPVVKVLKCVNQEIIYPAVMSIRNSLYEKFPYKDVKGGWKVLIVIDNNRASISHIKKEQSHDTTPQGRFFFQWHLSLSFDTEMITFEPNLKIVDITFEKMLPETKRMFMDSIFSFIDCDVMYTRSWQKPWDVLQVHKDIFRFLRKGGIDIVDEWNNIIYCHKGEENDTVELEKIFTVLAQNLDQAIPIDQTMKELQKIMKDEKAGQDNEERFLTFLTSEVISSDSITMKVIKCLNSDIIFPSYMTFRKKFYEEYPFKDVKGSWHVRIKIGINSVVVLHSKRERSHTESSGDYFEFGWALSLVFDREMTRLTSDLKIIDYSWSESTKQDTRNYLKSIWGPYLKKKSPPTANLETKTVSVQEALEQLLSHLQSLPNSVHVEHPDVGASLEALDLMKRLTESIKSINHPLPPVSIQTLS